MRITYNLEKQTSICACCHIEKPFSEFGACAKRTIGINWYCKECANEKRRKEEQKPGYKEKRAIIEKRYYDRHHDVLLEKGKTWAKGKYKKLREEGKLQNILLFNNAKNRAKRQGLPFNIELDDVVIPEYCPVLGVKLEFSKGKQSPFSASIDRIVPELGYVKGNIAVISVRANLIKSDGSLDEIKKVWDYCCDKLILEKIDDAKL